MMKPTEFEVHFLTTRDYIHWTARAFAYTQEQAIAWTRSQMPDNSIVIWARTVA